VTFEDLGPDDVREAFELAPFGFGNPAPLLLVRGIAAAEPRVMKERHLRLFLSQGRQGRVVKAWNWADRIGMFERGRRVSALVKIEPDDYSGFALTLEDARNE
jgi:single-stranded DNA-specific DHH superfamily exonuclease